MLAILLGLTLAALAQNGNLLGTRAPRQETQEEIEQEITSELNGHALRKIDGKIHNLRAEGESKSGIVVLVDHDVVILKLNNDADVPTYWALKNYSDAIKNQTVSVRALNVGKYSWGQYPLELWDCGTILTPVEEKKMKGEFDEAQNKIQQDQIEAAQLKKFITNSNEVVRLKLAAWGGSAPAQYSLALHYLSGQGCETNKAIAIHWLKIASDAGDFGASNKLAKLESLK